MGRAITAAIGITVVTLFFMFVNHKVERKVEDVLDVALHQSIVFSDIDSSALSNEIVIKDAIVFDKDASPEAFNFKAEILTFDVNYTNAVMRDFDVLGIEADNVVMHVDYNRADYSNYHAIQDNLRAHINERREAGAPRSTWDVYSITLKNISVELNDFELGYIGTFEIADLIIPHVSSKYTSQDNKNIIVSAVSKELFKQVLNLDIQGDYDRTKLAQFVAREGAIKTKESLGELGQKALLKTADLWQQFKASKD